MEEFVLPALSPITGLEMAMTFAELHREWMGKLRRDGFDDIESADALRPDPVSRMGAGALELAQETRSRASEALSDEMVWAGLTAQHRRFWALVVMGLDPEQAGRMVHRTRGGGGRAKSHAWHAEILRRIG